MRRRSSKLSVLFSEPKIPQFITAATEAAAAGVPFSALQRAENSSISASVSTSSGFVATFSALQRAENSSIWSAVQSTVQTALAFSALQRAENSSIVDVIRYGERAYDFQCSSASRKFLNLIGGAVEDRARPGFSALQRAENSSIRYTESPEDDDSWGFSALQRAENSSIR